MLIYIALARILEYGLPLEKSLGNFKSQYTHNAQPKYLIRQGGCEIKLCIFTHHNQYSRGPAALELGGWYGGG